MEITSIEEIRDPVTEEEAATELDSVDRATTLAMVVRQFQAAYRVAVRNEDDLPYSFTDIYNFSMSIK